MYEVYMVMAGDTLESIAKKYGTSSDEIRNLNGFVPGYEVSVGSFVVVPQQRKRNYQYYTVQKGDSIYEIAQKYGVDYDLLLQANGLEKDDYIYPNQSLLLPASGMQFYLVSENETIGELLKKLKISIEELLTENDKIYLKEGQLLVFPKK